MAEEKKLVTAVNYDKLLRLFVGNDELKPALMRPNTVGDMTYSTDANAMIIIPNDRLINTYPAHEKVPNYSKVIAQAIPCDHIVFKDTSLFAALKASPMIYDTSPCDTCEGEGECSHCGQACADCDGKGFSTDPSKPMVHNWDKTYIRIAGKCFSPFQIAKLEAVVLEMMADTFTIIAQANYSIVIAIDDVQIFIARMVEDERDERPIFELKPIEPL